MEVIFIKLAQHLVLLVLFLGVEQLLVDKALLHIQPVLFALLRLALLRRELVLTDF